MGVFDSIAGRSGVANYGGHGMTTSGLMNVPSNGITPQNAGSLQNIELPPTDRRPRMYRLREADELTRAADIAEAGAEQAGRAYKAKSRIVAAAAKTQVHHRKYVGSVADATATIAAANVATGQHLHGLREVYARMGFSTDRAAEVAQMRVEAAAIKYRGLN